MRAKGAIYASPKKRHDASRGSHRSPAAQRTLARDARGALAHDLGVLGFDFIDHADLAGLAVGVFVDAEIFLGHLVDVGAGTVFGDLDDAAANLDVAVGIFGIDDGERDTRVAANVFIFLTALGGVEDDVLAVEVAPDGGDLRAAIGHEGGEAGEGALLEKIAIFFGDRFRHEISLRWCGKWTGHYRSGRNFVIG